VTCPCFADTPTRHSVLATIIALVVVFLAPSIAGAGQAATISGTVQYAGAQGPVSAERPILILVWDNSFLEGEPVAAVAIETNNSAFEVQVPAPGEYFLGYVLDTNGDAAPNVGNPFRVFENDFGTPGDPITAPAEDLILSFDDAVGMPGIRGTVTYTGSMGPVGEDRPLQIEVFRGHDLTDPIAQRPRLANNGDPYQVILLDSRFHFLQVYLDLNNNGQRDDGEPFTIYNDRTEPSGDPLPPDVADLDLTFGDGSLPTPTATATPTQPPAVISGTIEYTGELGPVSPSKPIIMFLLASPAFDGPPVAFALVDTNGGAFVLNAPSPGDYYLGMLLDTNGDNMPAVGDPYEIYNDRTMPPGDPLAAPQTGVVLSFGDAGGLPGAQGTATYTGSLGSVSETSPIRVGVFRDADFTDPMAQSLVVTNGGPYAFVLLGAEDHYLRAYLDLNNDDNLDAGEPLTLYADKITPPGDPLPREAAMLDISFGDGAVMTPGPTVTPTPERPTCVGDCNGDGQVTVDEIIVGVNIALGETDIAVCPAFDADGNGTVTVDELVQGIDNALNGCPQL